MPIAFVIATNGSTNNGTTVSVATSTHTAGNFAIIKVSTRTGSGGTIAYSSGGSGSWTQLGSQLNSGTTLGTATFYKFLDATDISSGPVVFTSGGANTKIAAVLMSFSGVDSSGTILAQAGQVNASSTNVDHPALTVSAQAMMLLALSGWANDSTTSQVSGWTKDTNATAASGGGPAGDRNRTEVQYRAFSSANPPAMTKVIGTAAVSTGRQVALKELAVGDLNINRSESVTVAEAIQADIPGDRSISVSESVLADVQLTDISAPLRVNPNFGGGDSVTVAEFIQVVIDTGLDEDIAVSDAITVTDIPRYPRNQVFLLERVTVSIEAPPTGDVDVTASDSVGVAEAVQVEITSHVAVSEAVTVTDLNRSYSDLIAVEDVATVVVEAIPGADLDLTTSDAVSVADAATAEVSDPQVDVSDSVAVAEAIETALESFVDVSDALSVAEAVETALEAFLAASESVSLAEAIDLALESFVDVSESVGVAEATDLAVESFVDVSDSTSVAEATELEVEVDRAVTQAVTVNENINIFIVDPGQTNIITDDGVEVAESVTLEVSDPQIDVTEAVSLAEAVELEVTVDVAASDSVGVAENVAVSIAVEAEFSISVSESVSLTDTPDLRLVGFIRTSDAISVTEARTLATGDHVIAVTDAVATAEATTVRLLVEPAVSESVSLVDAPDAAIGVNLFISDTVGVFDVELVTETAPQLFVSDTIGVSEKRIVLPPGGVIVISGRTLFVGTKPVLTLRDVTGGVVSFIVDEAGLIITDEAGEPLLDENISAGSNRLRAGRKPAPALRKVR